jgi:hypothetical protein
MNRKEIITKINQLHEKNIPNHDFLMRENKNFATGTIEEMKIISTITIEQLNSLRLLIDLEKIY